MPAPTVGTYNTISEGPAATDDGSAITLTNAPSAGGIVVVLAAAYSGSGGGTWSCTASGGSGVSITNRLNTLGTTDITYGLLIWTVEYSTAPTSLTVARSGASGVYNSIACVNISGQAGSYLDVVSTSTSGSSTTPTDTNLPDLTDSTDLVLGLMTRAGTAGTIAAGTNWAEVVELDEANSIQTLSVIQRTPGSTGSYDPAWTISSSDSWLAGGIAIKGTAASGIAEDTPLPDNLMGINRPIPLVSVWG